MEKNIRGFNLGFIDNFLFCHSYALLHCKLKIAETTPNIILAPRGL